LAIVSFSAISKTNPIRVNVNYTVFVPLTVKSGKDARHFLEQALALGLEPTPHPAHYGSLRKLSLYLPATLTAQIDAHPNPIARSDLIRGLISAATTNNGKSAVAVPQVHQSVKWTQHKAQQEMVDALMKAIASKKIVLLEGSTGIGKSRVIARAALKLPSVTTIGIFAPTLAVLYQLFEEFLETAKKELKIDPPSIALYIGRRNFVDLAKLEEILPVLEASTPEAAARAKRWIEQGGPAITETSKSLTKHTPVQWMVDDLIEVAPEISASSVACDDLSKPCPGLEAYQEAKEGIKDAKVIFSTHTMLCLWALHNRENRPALPPSFDAIFLDEAHHLEEAMANCTGNDLSIRHLHGSLREGYSRKDVSPNRWHSIDSLVTQCQQQLELLPPDYLVPAGAEGEPAYQNFRRIASALAKQLKDIKASDDTLWLKRIRRWHYTLEQIASFKFEARVTFSPKLRLPSVTIGPSFLRNHFESLWDSCQSACLLSATMYVCEKPGQFSSRFIRLKLCIPSDRALEVKPFIAPWIYNSPTLYTPDPADAEAFAYPGETEEPSIHLDKWLTTIARAIARAAKDAEGGTLVLCSSYADAEELGTRLASFKGRLITQQRDDSIKALTSIFKDKARAGKRPLWLATGAAWIGLL
jgi:Rad3-related DNA helicase